MSDNVVSMTTYREKLGTQGQGSKLNVLADYVIGKDELNVISDYLIGQGDESFVLLMVTEGLPASIDRLKATNRAALSTNNQQFEIHVCVRRILPILETILSGLYLPMTVRSGVTIRAQADDPIKVSAFVTLWKKDNVFTCLQIAIEDKVQGVGQTDQMRTVNIHEDDALNEYQYTTILDRIRHIHDQAPIDLYVSETGICARIYHSPKYDITIALETPGGINCN